MDKKGLVKFGICGILVFAAAIVFFTTLFSNKSFASSSKEVYFVGGNIRIDPNFEGEYNLKVVTPSTTFVRNNIRGPFLFKLHESGDYVLFLEHSGIVESREFVVIEESEEEPETPESSVLEEESVKDEIPAPMEESGVREDKIVVGYPVKWKFEEIVVGEGRIKIPSGAYDVKVYSVNEINGVPKRIDVQLENNVVRNVFRRIISFNRDFGEKTLVVESFEGRIAVEYLTEAPRAEERVLSEGKKEVKISSPEGLHYENVLAFTEIPEIAREKSEIKIFWKDEQRYLDFEAFDKDGDGKLDYVEWVVPHLSEQTFEIVIEITNAEHLDSSKEFVSDIYDEVKALDGVWSEEISDGHYVRVAFEQNLTSVNDITVYPRIVSGAPRIEIYEIDGTDVIASFDSLVENDYNKVYLTNLVGEQGKFDLKIVGGSVEFDYIVDPSAFPGGSVELTAQSCAEQSSQASQNNFPDSCDGTYSSSCGSSGDRLSCNDGIVENANSIRTTGGSGFNGYGGVRIEAYNSAVSDCYEIEEVFLCYEFWGASNQHTCTVGVSANGGSSWSDSGASCSGSAPGVTCIDVTSSAAWTCSNFFGSSGTRAMAKAQAQRTGGTGTQNWNFDVLFFNVSYSTPPLGDVNVILNSPENEAAVGSPVTFDFTPISSNPLTSCSLWDDSSGVFALSQTNSTAVVNGTNNFFVDSYSDGTYLWNVQCCSGSECEFSFSNRTFTVDNSPPNVVLVSPANDSTITDAFNFSFSFNVSDSVSSISSCSIYIDGDSVQTFDSISMGVNTVEQYLGDGTYIWGIGCEDGAGNVGFSGNRTINVNVNQPAFQQRFWETSSVSFTGNDVAVIMLNNTRDSVQNTAAFSLTSAQLLTMVEASSHFIGHNGAIIPSGSLISFSSSFTSTSGDIRVTWKLYVSNSSGETLLCQNGNDAAAGTPVSTGTITGTNSTCINQDVRLEPNDKLLLVLNGFNNHPAQTRSVTHAWDGLTSSFVDVNVTTEGFLDVELVSPLISQDVALGETFNAICEVSCSIGTCRNVNVHLQRNTSTTDWENIGSSGNLILDSGETNPHDVGDVGSAFNTTFVVEGGEISSDNNIRCVAVGSYDSFNGSVTASVNVGAAGAAAPVVNLTNPPNATWFNSSVELFYNVTDDNDNIANATLILNGQPNITNQSEIINGGINNFTLSLPDGIYNWSVRVTDDTNLFGEATPARIFYVDSVAPNIALDYPDDGSSFDVTSVDFNFTVVDSMASSLNCEIIVNGIVKDSFSAVNGSLTTRNIQGLGLGINFWNVSCLDLAGNLGVSETRNFSVSNTPSVVNLTSPPNNYFQNSSIIVLEYNATDSGELVQSQLILNGQPNITNQSEIINGGINNFTLSLPDGIYNWTVNVTDAGGASVVASPVRIFTIDTQTPQVNLNLPADEYLSTSSSVSFNFTVVDNIDSSLSCTMNVGGVSQSFSAANGVLTNRIFSGLSDGLKIWNVSCIDDSGNFNVSENREINISEPPKITLNTANNSFFNVSSFNLTYTPSDNTGFGVCELYVNDGFEQTNQSQILNSQQNVFSMTGMSQGVYTWYVLCTDSAGLQNQSQVRTFTVDLNGLSIELFYPENGSELFTDTVEFIYNATDDFSSTLACDINVNGEVVDSFSATSGAVTNRSVFFSFGGLKIWNVSCIDNALNLVTSETRNFTLAFAPFVELVSPENNTFQNESLVSFFYNVTDDNDNIANATLILNGQPNITNQSEIINGGINNFTLSLPDGIYNWSVRVTDDTSLSTTVSPERVLTIDTQEPSIVLNSPENEETLDWNEVSFNITVSDNIDSSLVCNINLNGFNVFENVNVSNGVDGLFNVSRDDGDYEWFVECIDDSGNYKLSEIRNFTIFAPPKVSLLSPTNEFYSNSSSLNFVYLAEDAIGISSCSIYLNGLLNQTSNLVTANQNNSFSISGIPEGRNNWTVECTDVFPDLNSFAPEALNFTVDVTPPQVSLNFPDDGLNTLRNVDFNFSAIDNLAQNLTCELYIDGNLNVSGIFVQNVSEAVQSVSGNSLGTHSWNVSCLDLGFNRGWSENRNFNVTLADLMVDETSISFNSTSPTEGENVLVSAEVYNLINVSVPNVSVSFYLGDPDDGGVLIGNSQSVDFAPLENLTVSVEWGAEIGTNVIFVAVDFDNVIEEWNDLNNKANGSLTTGAWHFVFGKIDSLSEFELSDRENSSVIRWSAANFNSGNVYVADSESNVQWTALKAIGRDVNGDVSSNDFSEIDSLLEMNGFLDSVENLYTDGLGNPINMTSFIVFNRAIENVPVANATNDTSFTTGILWDTSDDANSQFDSGEKEDLVLITSVNEEKQGAYGVYDYEIMIPVKLREYKNIESNKVVFYSELR